MRLPMVVAGELKDADWEQDVTCDRRVAKDRVVHSRNGHRARPEGIGCITMNARSPRAGLGAWAVVAIYESERPQWVACSRIKSPRRMTGCGATSPFARVSPKDRKPPN